jgi:hypothetical protein
MSIEKESPKSFTDERRWYDLDGRPIDPVRVVFHARITADSAVEPMPEGKPDPTGWFRVFCLSVSRERWVATNGWATYIVQLFHE